MDGNKPEKLGQLIKKLSKLVEEHSLTNSELADKAGVDPSQITRWLKGRHKPSGEAAIRLWIAFGQPDPVDEEIGRPPRGKAPFDRWSITSSGQNVVQVPAEASLLLDWLPSAENPTRDCIGVVNEKGGRRILLLDGPTRRKIANLEESFRTDPARAKESATDRLRLARYLAVSWSVTISYNPGEDYELRVAEPSDAIPANSPVDVFAVNREILEVFTTPEEATELYEESRRVAKDFPQLLDRFSEP